MQTAVFSSLQRCFSVRSLLAAALAASFAASAQPASAQIVPRMAPPGAPVNIPSHRTLPSYGLPMPPAPPPGPGSEYHTGSLMCTTGKTKCHINGDELLSQVDPHVETWLVKYVTSNYSKDGQAVVWSEPQFGIGPTPKSANQFAADIEAVGCYVTTITMMENAAITNLPSTVQISKRTKWFATLPTHGGVTPAEALPGPAALDLAQRRLLWQYERWADKLQPNKLDPTKPSQPDFLELAEFVSGIPGASYNEFNSPKAAQISNGILMDLMKARHYLGFAYTRWTATRALDAAHPTVKLTLSSQHKVAVDGFDQAQTYPITIGDVGNGSSYRVRIARLGDVKFKLNGVAAGTPVGIQPSAAVNPDRLVVIYENPNGDVVAEGSQVFMLDTVMDMVVPTLWTV